jgi:hypothetical protein
MMSGDEFALVSFDVLVERVPQGRAGRSDCRQGADPQAPAKAQDGPPEGGSNGVRQLHMQ